MLKIEKREQAVEDIVTREEEETQLETILFSKGVEIITSSVETVEDTRHQEVIGDPMEVMEEPHKAREHQEEDKYDQTSTQTVK